MKRILSVLCLVFLAACSTASSETPSEPVITETTEPEPTSAPTEETDPETLIVDNRWDGYERDYDGDYSYLELPYFRDNDIPTLRSACKVIKADSVEGMAGGWVYCGELNEIEDHYDLREVSELFDEDMEMHIASDGYYTEETIIYKDSLYYELLQKANEYRPIPAVYGEVYQPLESMSYFLDENRQNVFNLSVTDIGKNTYLLQIEYRVATGGRMTEREPYDYYRSAAIVKAAL